MVNELGGLVEHGWINDGEWWLMVVNELGGLVEHGWINDG